MTLRIRFQPHPRDPLETKFILRTLPKISLFKLVNATAMCSATFKGDFCIAFRRSEMEPVVSVSRKEWDAFFADHSRLIERYQLLLSRLEAARTAIQSLNEKTQQQMAKSGETLKQLTNVLDKLCEETEGQLLGSD